ncbi:MAG: NAD(P)/FAD-dependent oxidoreductase [Alicyclobacillus sp.]|nr:NAD(P)/FAD-dependent oxidoreductase [Alicyclobacillus sp.]
MRDVIVVGGGPAGLMAAIAAAEAGADTLLIEKGHRLGRKLGISGGGRCNVTNAKPLPELMKNIPGNGRFLYSALHRFSNEDVRRFFESLGIRLKEEDRGRVFPVSDRAETVVKALVNKVFDVGAEVWEDCPVAGLLAEDGEIRGVRLQRGGEVRARAVVVATGGCSVPKTGSTGDAYPWARRLGHTIVDPYPTEVPLTSDESFIRQRRLQGISLRGITATVRDGHGKRLTQEQGDILFTHFGLSGPVALRCSHYVSTARRSDPAVALTVEIDCLPNHTLADLLEDWARRRSAEPRKRVRTVLEALLPDRLVEVAIERVGIPVEQTMANVRNTDLESLAHLVKAFPIRVSGTLPLAQATVTGGGVSVKEIDPRTMESKRCRGLYFAGEVMDVHAHTGGYNITVAFSTGHLAGTSAAEHALALRS